MKRFAALVLVLESLLLGACSVAGMADDPAAAVAPDVPPAAAAPVPPRAMRLGQMLHHISPAPEDPLLTVNRARRLTGDAPPPVDDSGPLRLSDAEEAYDLTLQRMGTLHVLVPAHRLALVTNLGPPDPVAGITNTTDALRMLAATLTDDQWRAWAGTQGLPLRDLQTPEQRALLAKVLQIPIDDPDHEGIRVALASGFQPALVPGQPLDVPIKVNQLQDAVLFLRKHVNLTMALDDSMESDAGYSSTKPQPARWMLIDFSDRETSTVEGQPVSRVEANDPKPSDLDFKQDRWNAPVMVTDGMPLRDIVSKIGTATQSEIVCDKGLEDYAITLIPASATLRSGDALAALASCVGGTFRSVEPLFILTEDLQGLGAREQLLQDYKAAADGLRSKLLADAEERVIRHTFDELQLDDKSGLDITPDERKRIETLTGHPVEGGYLLDVPFEILTPAQQDYVQSMIRYMRAHPKDIRRDGIPVNVSTAQKVIIMPVINLSLQIPGVDGLVSLPVHDNNLFFADTKGVTKRPHAMPPVAKHDPVSRKDWMDATGKVPCRAAYVSVTTPDQLPGIVRDMTALGLNQLWLNAFSGGVSHVYTRNAHGTETNLLEDAVKVCRRHGIAVYAMVSLWNWGKHSPDADVDLSILGETSPVAAVKERQQQMLKDPRMASLLPFFSTFGNSEFISMDPGIYSADSPDFPTYVAPSEPDVVERLRAVHRQIAHTPGVAGVVWQDLDPSFLSLDIRLGYTLRSRVEYIRHSHVDPIDVPPGGENRVDLPSRIFDLDSPKLLADWIDFRQQNKLRLLAHLRPLAVAPSPGQSAAVPRPLLVAHQSIGMQCWYGSWDSPTSPLLAADNVYDEQFVTDGPHWKTAKTQSRLAILNVQPWGQPGPGQLANNLKAEFAHSQWDGFVFKLYEEGTDFPAEVRRSQRWLADLASDVHPTQDLHPVH